MPAGTVSDAEAALHVAVTTVFGLAGSLLAILKVAVLSPGSASLPEWHFFMSRPIDRPEPLTNS